MRAPAARADRHQDAAPPARRPARARGRPAREVPAGPRRRRLDVGGPSRHERSLDDRARRNAPRAARARRVPARRRDASCASATRGDSARCSRCPPLRSRPIVTSRGSASSRSAPGFSGETLAPPPQRRNASVKGMLMDAAVVVGVGNIYASEALHRAGHSSPALGGAHLARALGSSRRRGARRARRRGGAGRHHAQRLRRRARRVRLLPGRAEVYDRAASPARAVEAPSAGCGSSVAARTIARAVSRERASGARGGALPGRAASRAEARDRAGGPRSPSACVRRTPRRAAPRSRTSPPLAISTKPKPRGRPVSRSVMRFTDSTLPYELNSSRTSSAVQV